MMLPVTICILLLGGCFNSDIVAPDPAPAPAPEPPPKPDPAPPAPAPAPDPEPEPVPVSPHQAECADYCSVICLIDNGRCPACLPSPGGVSCQLRCERQLDTGIIPLNTACRKKQGSCAALQFCEQ